MFYYIYLLFFILSVVVYVMSFLNIDENDKKVITILSALLFLFLAGLSLQVEYLLQDGSIITRTDWISLFICSMLTCTQALRLFFITYTIQGAVQNG